MAFFVFIFLLLLVAYTILIEFYRRSWNAIEENFFWNTTDIKVSLVIPLRNEEKNVEQLLANISAQSYPYLEVILIDDHSNDSTWNLLQQQKLSNVKCVQLAAHQSGKKPAIETGIYQATGQLIVTTDADCKFGTEWINTIACCYAFTGAKFIAAPVKMVSKKNFIGVFQSLDFLALQGITGATVHKHFHAMCNGANLAYEKQAFIEVNGFAGIDKIPSGDDMLLMHKISKKYPGKTFYLKNKSVIVETEAELSWKNFFHQRIRWASKAVHYDDKKIFYVLLLTYVVNLFFIAMAVAAAVNIYWLWFLVLFFIMKVTAEFPFVNSVAVFFGQQRLMIFFPLMQPFHIIYTIVAGWLGRFGSYEWKSRTVKNNGKKTISYL